MYSRIAIIILIQLLYSRSSHKNNAELNKVTFIDSLKWDIYAANFEYKALNIFYPKDIVLEPVQCEVSISRIDTVSIDTTEYFFHKFYETDTITNRVMMNTGFEIVGIGITRTGNEYPIGSFTFSFWNEDSCRLYFKKNDENFTTYLQSYKGEMSPWLKKEAIRRGVLKEAKNADFLESYPPHSRKPMACEK